MSELNVQKAIEVINKLAERNRKNSFSTKGESEMRVKLADLREIIRALETRSTDEPKCEHEVPIHGDCVVYADLSDKTDEIDLGHEMIDYKGSKVCNKCGFKEGCSCDGCIPKIGKHCGGSNG